MKTVGIYRKAFPRVSEAFIKEQAYGLTRYDPTFILCTLLGKTSFRSISVSQNDLFRVKQLAYLLTRSPSFFSHIESLSKLSLIHAHFGHDGVYAMAIAEKLKIPFLVTFHGEDITISRRTIWRPGKLLYSQLVFHEMKLKKKAAAFIAVSRFIRSKLIERGYPEAKIIQHYIGIDTAKFSPIDKRGDERYILCVGRHTQKKGIDTLLRAFARVARKYPDVSLIQVGTGPMTSDLITLAKVLGIDHCVRFLGAQPHETVLKLMRDAEIFALPSQTAKDGSCEGLPIVINEASACGVPIISTWHSGIPEGVLDGETGFLVAERDDKALAEKLNSLLADRTLGREMGKRGREFTCEMFDIHKQTTKLEAIYDSLAP